ncbi:MAG TPA: SDR family oxidoreductase [Oligoflexus sp.]|uniref:SDR family oxidoreductase n=1 Tax=Oligoflexus sp. TaxID=1971216 RepID=UPI002D7E5CC9|nr:SDR family oxidoreductase [Oligoflexus sp.]HET9235626.1 SDR family oxidoreductase [Oligoflexus sp.]
MDFKKPFDLSGKIALVTGSSRGIGASIARLLAAQGAQVIVSSRKQDACEAIVAQIRSEGGKAEAIACHIGEMESIAALFSQIRERHGRLDILVNNAAANPYFGPILDTTLEAYQKTVDVNIRGYFFASVEGGRLMKEKGGGTIVNVASINAENPGMYQGIYSVTKAAIVSMTKSFAKECAAFNIRVNALLPGATDTKFAATLVKNEKILNQLMPHVPMQRVAQPDEMAGAVLYLVSPAASYTTGSCLTVDGGFLIG